MNNNENTRNDFISRMDDESGIVIQENTGLPTPSIEERHKMMDEKLETLLKEIYGDNGNESLEKPRIR